MRQTIYIRLWLLLVSSTATAFTVTSDKSTQFNINDNADSGKLLGETLITPHKTASVFLMRLFDALARQIGACKLTDSNCLLLSSNPLCREVVHGAVEVPQTNWGPACEELYTQALSGDAGRTVLNFDATPYIYTHRGDNGSVQYPTGDTFHQSTIVWHHRHPFDAECSAYVSYGWHHPKPPGMPQDEWNDEQERIRKLTADVWVENHIQERIDYMKYACEQVQGGSGRHVLSSYEDMVSNFTVWFLAQVQRAVGNNRDPEETMSLALKGAYGIDTTFSNDGRHQTHLQPGRYLEELTPEAIKKLKDRVRSSVPDHCLCELMKYKDFCEDSGERQPLSFVQYTMFAHAGSAIDPLLEKLGFDDE